MGVIGVEVEDWTGVSVAELATDISASIVVFATDGVSIVSGWFEAEPALAAASEIFW
jgi:hypothetical protein